MVTRFGLPPVAGPCRRARNRSRANLGKRCMTAPAPHMCPQGSPGRGACYVAVGRLALQALTFRRPALGPRMAACSAVEPSPGSSQVDGTVAVRPAAPGARVLRGAPPFLQSRSAMHVYDQASYVWAAVRMSVCESARACTRRLTQALGCCAAVQAITPLANVLC